MSIIIPTLTEKCKGAMLATAIGDALGWPNEPRSKNRTKKPKVNDFFVEWTRSCKEPRWHDERILAGEYSDDTQMMMSVARSIIAGDWERFLAEKELPFWLRYERGGGSAMLKAARFLSEKKEMLCQSRQNAKAYFNAGGNGAAMRILPHVIANANKPDISTLMLDVIKDTLITHGHPRAFLGATSYAYALDYLMRKNTVLEFGELVSVVIEGQELWGNFPNSDVFGYWIEAANKNAEFDYISEWEKSRNNMLKQLEFIKTSLKKGLMLDDTKILNELGCFDAASGAGDVAALTAVYFASRYATNPALGIKVAAFSFKTDTDTIASITGGLLGMLCGIDWIPTEWKIVQNFECLNRMAELLLSDDKKATTKAAALKIDNAEAEWKLTPIGKIRFIESREYPNAKYGVVLVSKWQTSLGQTFYTKEFRPNETCKQQATFEQISESGLSQKSKKAITCERQFTLEASNIRKLLGEHKFNGKVTVGKALKVILAILENDESVNDIAKRFDLDKKMVSLLKNYVIYENQTELVIGNEE